MFRRHTTATKMDLKLIHQAFTSEALLQQISLLSNPGKTFEDALSGIETSSRPSDVEKVENLRDNIISAVLNANDDEQKWKLIILTILRKRYHMKAPEAKSIKHDKNNNNNNDDGDTSTGLGERLSFYISFLTLYYLSTLQQQEQEQSNDDNDNNKLKHVTEYSTKACTCLSRLAVAAGGTRDICTLIEHLVYASLLKNGIFDIHTNTGKKRAVSAAVILTVQSESSFSSLILDDLIKAASELLDKDFQLIKTMKEAEDEQTPPEKKEEVELQSTINTFIPHHNRGTDVRRLTQSLAELMIWNATTHSSTDVRFTDAIKAISSISLSSPPTIDSSADEKVIFSLHTIQTAIRRFRKVLNESSRKQGFSLCSSYSMDPSSITLSMVKRGREGDVMSLQKIARKKVDKKIIKLIANRSTDPSKAIPISSMRGFCNNWIPLEAGDKQEGDELMSLNLKLQEATVLATIKLLQQKVKQGSDSDVVVASLDRKVENDCAAILIACALSPKFQRDGDSVMEEEGVDNGKVKLSLFIGEREYDNLTSMDAAMSLLNEICTTAMNNTTGSIPATTKDVQNFIERHVEPNSQLILMTSTDIKIEQRVLTDLQTNKNTIHCHMMDDFQYRMNRERAKVGDITITLAWDNECDLDLHCICPNGDHISYSFKTGGGEIGGGYLDVDMNADGPYSKEPVENIFFGDAEKGIEAAKGKYKVFVQNYAYHGKEVKHNSSVPWRVRVVKNGKIHNYTGACTGTSTPSNATVVEFEYNGREAPLPEKVGSALDSSTLVSVTSSTGDTIESIAGLLSAVSEHKELAVVEELVRSETEMEVEEKSDEEGDEANSNNVRIRPLMAERKAFDITNRDRLYLNLSKLPKLFHLEVNRCFSESMSLVEFTASTLAQRLIEDKIPIEELKSAGYQEDIMKIVQEKMRTFGL